MEFTLEKIAENMYAIEQQGVRAFLLIGPERAVLVDTCFGGDILSACRSVTDLPITLITTHADPDHMGCDKQFPDQHLHSGDLPRYESKAGDGKQLMPVQDGDLICVGEYNLEVIWIPGHTPGSIALLDREHRFLISGDTVQGGCIFMHGEGRDLHAFHKSIGKLEQLRKEGAFHRIFPSHGERMLPADILEDHMALAEEILAGSAVPVAPGLEWFPETVKVYRHGRAQMYYDMTEDGK